MDAYDVKVEWDEDGCYVIVDGPSLDPDYQAGEYRFRVADPEQLYDRVKGAIGPWLRERDDARATMPYDREAFECEDPFEAWVDMLADNADHSRKVAKGE